MTRNALDCLAFCLAACGGGSDDTSHAATPDDAGEHAGIDGSSDARPDNNAEAGDDAEAGGDASVSDGGETGNTVGLTYEDK